MKCKLCKKGKAEISICDAYDNEIIICEKCDLDLFDADTLKIRVIKEIDKQIEFHKEEDNKPAIASLEYIKEVIKN